MLRERALDAGRRPAPERSPAPSGLGAPPAIAVPKGGGAIRGIDERFSVNAVAGTAGVSIPIAVSPGRQGISPQLTLSYDSGAGNGPFGIGWSLALPTVGRRTDRGVPRYADAEESDTFVLAGAEDLVPALVRRDGAWVRDTASRVDADGEAYTVERYRPRVEGAFARIEQWRRQATGDVHWRSVSRENVTGIYGRSPESRIADPADDGRVFRWLLEESFDDRGNVVRYEYKPETADAVDRAAPEERHRLFGQGGFASRYLKRIRYGNRAPFVRDGWLFEVVLDYGEHDPASPTPEETRPWPARPDAFSTCRAGFEIRTYRLCQRVLTFHRMEELGDLPYLVRSTDFTYAPNPVATRLVAATQRGYVRDEATGAIDVESLPPVEFTFSDVVVDDTVHEVDPDSLEHLPSGVDGRQYRWVDLDGEGISGVLTQEGSGWFYKRNLGDSRPVSFHSAGDHPPPPPSPVDTGPVRFAPARQVAAMPSLAELSAGTQQLIDLAGNGTLDLVLLGGESLGYYEHVDGAWRSFEPFVQAPALDWESPNVRLVDLSGDGHADALITEDEVFTWYPSRARRGFGASEQVRHAVDEERGPRVVFADGTESVYLADMDGDGLTDLVRIKNGEVCYWPSLGHGRFGAKVTMDAAPRFDYPDLFEQQRLRLADIDGSGTTDLIYLGRDAVSLWFNQSGNRWSTPRRLTSFPPVDDLSTVSVVDLLGNGTACLVWSSPLARDASRPMRYVELMGGRKPHLLTAVRNNLGAEQRVEYAPSTRFSLADRAAGRPWVTRLPFPVHVVERVEVRDAITGSTLVSRYAYHHGFFDGEEREFRGFGLVEQWDAESFAVDGAEEPPSIPPVYTKSWFHTGAYFEGATVSRQFAAEYYTGDPQAVLLPDTVLPPDADGEEARQACRALRGRLLRQETYAVDGTAERVDPYAVSEHNYELRLVQPRRDGIPHAVVFAHARESITYHYERRPDDPRVGHTMALAVDDFGNVTRLLAVAYPRRAPEFPEQARTLATVVEADFINRPDEAAWYRVGVPAESRSYELTGAPPPAAALYTQGEMRAALAQSAEIPYEAEPTDGAVEMRLIEQSRALYYRDDLSGPLPRGEVESRALPFESYLLAFTPGLLAEVYGDRVDAALLSDEGRYVPDADGTWWVPSGRPVYDPERFFAPVRTIDPFGHVTTVTYDAHALLVVRTEDPLGNVVAALPDYRTLEPRQVTDANGNRTAVAFDALGLAVATALMGKGAGEGDTLDDPTTRVEYDRFAWLDRGRPAFAHTFAREQHGPGNPRFQESVTYTDGFGRVVMTKVQAEPGPAPLRDAEGALVLDGGEPVLADTSPAVRWVGTGRTVYDNKGNPVRQYEPSFSSTPEFEDEAELVERGVTAVLRYDPLGRAVRTDLPNGTLARVAVGPWSTLTWDANDTVLESDWLAARQVLPPGDPERRAADLAAAHAETPTVAHADTLGRTFLTEVDDGAGRRPEVRVAFDIEGRPLVVTDARGNLAETNTFSMLGARVRHGSADGGERRLLANAAGNPMRAWDGRGHVIRAVYDALQRPTHRFVRGEAGGEVLLARTVYGEAHPDAASGGPGLRNLRGQVHQQYDGAGVVINDAFDFAGNLLERRRRLAREFRDAVDWSPLAALTDVGGIEAAAAPLLEDETFTSRAAYDALGRVVSLTTPDGSEALPTYDEANLLDRLEVRLRGAAGATPFITNVDYNARGQCERMTYVAAGGASVTTEYGYEAETFRLARLQTARAADGRVLQDLRYTYDPVGNVTEIRDDAQQTVFFDNAEVAPDARYEYDALYRLTRADGREHAGLGASAPPDHRDSPAMPVPHRNDGQALRAYTERYEYDRAGNILRMMHAAAGGSWTRRYAYAADANRLLATNLPGDSDGGPFSATYDHDAHGSMTRMPHLPRLAWDAADRLRVVDLGGGGTAFYVYDAAGRRVRAVVERLGATSEERIYLDGFELFRRRRNGSLALERETLHVVADARRIALVETLTRDAGVPVAAPTPRIRYQLGNHLGSASLELDDAGAVISYEEYHPFGTTAYRAARADLEASPKRYRYTGKERDEETGLYDHGARYYAPWLGRWTAADPAGPVDGPNLYRYARNNPIALVDRHGLSSAPPETLREEPPPPPVRENFGTDEAFLQARQEWGRQVYRTVVTPRAKGSEPRSESPRSSLLEKAAGVLGPAGRILEGAFWNPYFGKLTKTERFLRNSARGFRFDRAAGNNAGRSAPAIDRITPTTVEQVKSVYTDNPKSIRGQVQKAARVLQNWMDRNPTIAETRKAVLRVIMPTGASDASADLARAAVEKAKVRAAAFPDVTVNTSKGLPGLGAAALRWLGFAGGAVSAWGLAQDIKAGDVYSGVGNAAGTTSFAMELGAIGLPKLGVRAVALGSAGAVVGSGAAGWGVGRAWAESAGEGEYWSGAQGERMSPEEHERHLEQSSPFSWPDNWWLEFIP